jgi:hypothetical protein
LERESRGMLQSEVLHRSSVGDATVWSPYNTRNGMPDLGDFNPHYVLLNVTLSVVKTRCRLLKREDYATNAK